jgi:hypothetical protein
MSSVPVGRSEVRQFVVAVRAALDDLSPDEIEELTGGLEADLDDALDDAGGDPGGQAGSVGGQSGSVAGLGDPTRYAEELRAAAGLPARAGGGDRLGGVVAVLRAVRERRDAVHARLQSRRWWPAAQEHAAAARPFWWVARAWIAFQILHDGTHQAGGYGDVLPLSPPAWLVFLALVAGSVELGRLTRAAQRRAATQVAGSEGGTRQEWALRLLLLVNVVAVLAVPAAYGHSQQAWQNQQSFGGQQIVPPPDGLWHNGTELRNLFAYDSRGNPLTGVQLYDENGNPVDVGTSARTPLSDADGNTVAQVPAVGQDGSQRWNVFPLRQQVIPPYVDPAPGADRTSPYPPQWPTPVIPPALAPTAVSSAPTAITTSTARSTPTPTLTAAPTVTVTP